MARATTLPTTPPSRRKYRLTRDIAFPKGNRVVYVGRMKHDIYRAAMAIVSIGPDLQYELFTNWDEAVKQGLIEEVTE